MTCGSSTSRTRTTVRGTGWGGSTRRCSARRSPPKPPPTPGRLRPGRAVSPTGSRRWPAVLARWSEGVVADRRERRIAIRLSAENAEIGAGVQAVFDEHASAVPLAAPGTASPLWPADADDVEEELFADDRRLLRRRTGGASVTSTFQSFAQGGVAAFHRHCAAARVRPERLSRAAIRALSYDARAEYQEVRADWHRRIFGIDRHPAADGRARGARSDRRLQPPGRGPGARLRR